MGFRFRKSFKVGKGVKLNVGNKSIGISAGGKRGGVSINSRSGTRARVSAPGTGISYSTKLSGGKRRHSTSSSGKKTASSRATATEVSPSNIKPKKAPNPPKPPKLPKVYLVCGVLIIPFGLLFLIFCWPLGLLFTALGIYYIACGPKIYAKLVEDYKALHPEFEDFTIK